VLRIFTALKKSIALAGFEAATFGFSGKYTNHYTTKATKYTDVSQVFTASIIRAISFSAYSSP
jgi:hypothetical protein